MKHDSRIPTADGVTQRDGAAVDVELAFVERAERGRKAKLLGAEVVAFPRSLAGDHLGRRTPR
jgi:hypothetical protein